MSYFFNINPRLSCSCLILFCLFRALEMFAETLLIRANEVTTKRGARTLTPSHLKFCIESESRFDFLRELVAAVPDLQSEAELMDAATGLGIAGAGGGGMAAVETHTNITRQEIS